MKKRFRQDDGSFVTIEGSPEEIREYERMLERDRAPKPSKQQPDVLKGIEAGNDELRRLLDELQKPERRGSDPSPAPTTPWWPAPSPYISWCVRCGGCPCVCHVTYPTWPLYPQIWYRTVTTTGNITLPAGTYDGPDGLLGMY